METEQERLQKLYAEMGDEHLLDMADDRGDLTDAARLALAQELRRRGITPEPRPGETMDRPIVMTEEPERESGFSAGIPGMFPSTASMMEQALEAPQTTKTASPRSSLSTTAWSCRRPALFSKTLRWSP